MLAAIKSGGEKAAADYFDRLVAEAKFHHGRRGQ
jgi:hypothetical protein